MAAALIAPHLPGCAYASALCIVINGIARTPKRSRRLISGTPLYLYQVALAFQILVYPALTLSAWSASRGGLYSVSWLKDGWGSNAMADAKLYERAFMCAVMGFMVKDLYLFKDDALFFLHHVVAIVGLLLFFVVPAGLGSFILGTTIFELGNFTFNIALVYGKDSGRATSGRTKHLAEVCYAVGMPLSNVVGGAMFLWFATFPGLKGTSWVYGLGAMWFGLIAGRLLVVYGRWGAYVESRKLGSARGPGGERRSARVAAVPAGPKRE
jgi:hypothetical protein